MNYIKCPNCHSRISEKSSSCIYCGVTKEIIDQELRAEKIRNEKELASQIEGFYNNHKHKVIIIEIGILIVIGIIYAYSYIPEILEDSKQQKTEKQYKTCAQYGGVWDSEKESCTTEFGVINIK